MDFILEFDEGGQMNTERFSTATDAFARYGELLLRLINPAHPSATNDEGQKLTNEELELLALEENAVSRDGVSI
jgi:hypothetical protein